MRSIFSGGGAAAPLPLAGGCGCGCARLLVAVVRQSVDQFPQFVQSFARDRRNRQHGVFKHGFEFSQRADPFAARELVDLGRRPRAASDRRAAATARPRGRSRGPDAARRPAAAPPAAARTPRRHDRLERQPRVSASNSRAALRAAARVAVSRQIHQVERRGAAARDAVHVRQPRLARRRARARDALPDQRVDQARLADVRAADHRHFRQAIARKVAAPAALVTNSASIFKRLVGLEAGRLAEGLSDLPDPSLQPAS